MDINVVKCEVVKVNTETGICPGRAKTELGEVYLLDARTPSGEKGICCQAFSALASMKLVYQYTDKLEMQKTDYFDITCPHGNVVFRLSRVK